MSGTAPRLDDINLASHDFFVQEFPHEAFRLLREHDPVHWQPERPPNHGFWTVTRYRDMEVVLRDAGTFSSEMAGVVLEEMSQEELDARRSMIELDPPRHTRMRKIVSPFFTPRAVRAYEDYCRELAIGVLDRALAKGELDFVEDVSRELPIRVLARILGVPEEDTPQLIEWGDAMIGSADPEYTPAPIDLVDTSEYRLLPFRSPAARDLTAYGHDMAELRREDPRDDLVSKLVRAEVEGQRLTEREFDNFFCLLVVAGNETTRHAITHGMLAFMDHRDQWERLVGDPSLMPTAVEEILRWATPTMHFRRTATKDAELRGERFKRGDKVVAWFASADFDDEVFPDPYAFDVGRDPNPHVAFGFGAPHFCLGAHLARLEIRVMFEELLPRLLDIELTGPIVRLRSNFINGVKHMPVRVRAN